MKSKDSNWDIGKYKYHYELEHQWNLKKKFIEAHKEKYPEDSYEDNIMKLIHELSKGIAEKNSKWEKQSFVAASDAVEERVKAKLTRPPSTSAGDPAQQNQDRYGYNQQNRGYRTGNNPRH